MVDCQISHHPMDGCWEGVRSHGHFWRVLEWRADLPVSRGSRKYHMADHRGVTWGWNEMLWFHVQPEVQETLYFAEWKTPGPIVWQRPIHTRLKEIISLGSERKNVIVYTSEVQRIDVRMNIIFTNGLLWLPSMSILWCQLPYWNLIHVLNPHGCIHMCIHYLLILSFKWQPVLPFFIQSLPSVSIAHGCCICPAEYCCYLSKLYFMILTLCPYPVREHITVYPWHSIPPTNDGWPGT